MSIFQEFIKFPSIEQYRHIVKLVRSRCDYHGRPYPVIKFIGEVKLHGTNAAVRINNGQVTAQSRERDLTLLSDNAGFAAFVERNKSVFLDYSHDPCVIFGEWCGGNIQNGVALNQLPKMFVPFAHILEDDQFKMSTMCRYVSEDGKLIVVSEHRSYQINIDFARPEDTTDLLTRYTLEVEAECPFGKALGVLGIGEGIVWHALMTEELEQLGLTQRDLLFKTKGDKHCNPGTNNKVKVAVSAERVHDMNELIAKILPDWRLNQGLEHVSAKDRSATGEYLKWVSQDIIKEESDTILASGFEVKIVMAEASKKARQFFFSVIDSEFT